jgi:biotin carboxylase
MAEFTRLSRRAMTFDDRKSFANTVAAEKDFSMILKRAMTFNEKYSSSGSAARERAQSFSHDDVMYRKHFGLQSEEVKPFSMMMQQGIEAQECMEPIVEAQEDNSNKAVVVVDTFTTGAMLANMLYKVFPSPSPDLFIFTLLTCILTTTHPPHYTYKMGYKIICVLSADLKDLLKMVPDGLEVSYEAIIMYDTSIDADAAFKSVMGQIGEVHIPIVAVLAGAETGVELADQLSEAMGMRTNGTELSEARRNKYVMGETVRNSGLRAVKQLRATVWREIEEWLESWQPDPFKVIVKPMDSAGSDDVTLCRSMDDVKNAFGNIMGKVNGLGIVNKAVLVQEYLEGTEYVIDMVSRDGEHKVAGIWVYDRRPVNGAGFVLFGQKMLAADAEHVREIIEYQKKVCTALGIRHGPTHGEVKWCKGEPVLVEVGARCHGGDGLWVKLASEAFGYNQVQCTIDSYLYRDRWAAIPVEPAVCLAYACIKWSINYTDGIFQRVDATSMAAITSHSAYRGHQVRPSVHLSIYPSNLCPELLSLTSVPNLCPSVPLSLPVSLRSSTTKERR